MTSPARYLAGYAAAATLGAGLALAAPEPARPAVGFGVLAALVLQGPLGWWAVHALGSERFTLVWGLGALVRFAVLALLAFKVVPATGWPAGPVLLPFVGIMGVLFAVEGFTALRHQPQEERR
ncbi:MAG TPA: hypothetical protein VFK09_05270 [Gemmatimonadales bacterium]|nr:hypothetical protein [Gemmatimonadales bacterium]